MIKNEDFSDIKSLIVENTRQIKACNERRSIAYDRYKKNRAAWLAFCEEPYPLPPIADYLNRIENVGDTEALTFAIRFLALDPWFDDSGYIKEKLLHNLKQRVLTSKQIEYLNAVLLDAVEHRGQREFRHYCRLARKIATPKFIHQLEVIVENGAWDARRSRAKLMLKTILQA